MTPLADGNNGNAFQGKMVKINYFNQMKTHKPIRSVCGNVKRVVPWNAGQ